MGCEPQAARARLLDLVERAAIGASFLCLVHCVGLPVLLAALPALGHLIPLPERLHLWLLGFAIPSSALALGFGYRRHGTAALLPVGTFGLALMALGGIALAGTRAETLLTVAGSLTLAGAHLGNWRLRHRGHRHG